MIGASSALASPAPGSTCGISTSDIASQHIPTPGHDQPFPARRAFPGGIYRSRQRSGTFFAADRLVFQDARTDSVSRPARCRPGGIRGRRRRLFRDEDRVLGRISALPPPVPAFPPSFSTVPPPLQVAL